MAETLKASKCSVYWAYIDRSTVVVSKLPVKQVTCLQLELLARKHIDQMRILLLVISNATSVVL
jgi:hypothetical protein